MLYLVSFMVLSAIGAKPDFDAGDIFTLFRGLSRLAKSVTDGTWHLLHKTDCNNRQGQELDRNGCL